MVRVVNLDFVIGEHIGRKDRQIEAAGMTERGKQQGAQSGGDHLIGEPPGWRHPAVDTGDPAPGANPMPPLLTQTAASKRYERSATSPSVTL